jgi:hypothetical protein
VTSWNATNSSPSSGLMARFSVSESAPSTRGRNEMPCSSSAAGL